MNEQGEMTSEAERPAAARTTRAYLDLLKSSGAPALETLSVEEARLLFVQAQKAVPVELPPAEISHRTIIVDGGEIPLVIVRPGNVKGTLPAFLFFHGGGWVLGDFPTHERFVRELTSRSGAVGVFVEYGRSPEVRYPVANGQAYGATRWVAENGHEIGVDGSRLAVVGNSAGGNMATVVALRAKLEGGPEIRHQTLFWPATDAAFVTESHEQFREGYALTRGMMEWFWDHYLPEGREREGIFVSPPRATLEQLGGLPPALIQTAELDVLRDEGEAYARKLDAAGVDVVCVRVAGMIHDFAVLNFFSQVGATRAAISLAAGEIKRHLE